MNLFENENLYDALRNVNFEIGKEEETFNFVVYISTQFGFLLPIKNETGYSNEISRSHETDNNRLKNNSILDQFADLVKALTTHYVQQINAEFSKNATLTSSLSFDSNKSVYYICTCLEKLQVLVGEKSACDKFSILVSRYMDVLRQQIITSFQNPLTNLQQINKNFKSLSEKTKCLINTVLTVITCSRLLENNYQKIISFVQETILEKMSSELLTLTHSIKESLISLKLKPDSQTSNMDHKRVHSLSELSASLPIISLEVLTDFADIVNHYLLLDEHIFNSDILAIMDSTCNARQNKSNLKQHSPFELPDLIRSSQQSSTINRSNTPISIVNKWPWFESLRDLTTCISNSLVHHISQINSQLLDEGKTKYKLKDDSAFETKASVSGTILSSKHNPKLVITWMHKLLQTILDFLPYSILGGKYKQMIKFQSDYLDVINQALKDLKPFIMTLIEDFPEFVSPDHLPTLLASAHDIVAILEHCACKMQHDGRMPFHGSIQLYTSLCKRIQQTIVQYHKNKLSTTLLHDAASHHWNDLRPFFEEDKYSFAIQMWRTHLLDLFSDLNLKLWDELSRTTISEILSASLCVLSNRYTRCVPSHNRNKQVKLDITAILFTCYEFLWQLAPSTVELFPTQPCYYETDEFLSKIHKNCMDLFLCLNIVSSPLPQLHSSILHKDENKLIPVQWLSYCNPTLFPIGWDGTSSALSDPMYIICCLKLLCFQKENCAAVTMHLLKTRNCFLSKQLVSNTFIDDSENAMSMQKHLLEVLSNDANSFSQIFIECIKLSQNFTHSMFLNLDFLGNPISEAIAPWQECLHNCIILSISNCLQTVLEFLSLISNLSKIPKIQTNEHLDSLETFLDKTDDIVKICICLILQNLKMAALTLPESFQVLFVDIDRLLHSVHLQDAICFKCYGAHVLLYAVYQSLSNTRRLEKDFNIAITEDVLTNLKALLKFLKNFSSFDYHNSKCEMEGFDLKFEVQSYKKCTKQLFSSSNQCNLHPNCEKEFELLSLDAETVIDNDKIGKNIKLIYKYLCKNVDKIASKYQVTKLAFENAILKPSKSLDDLILNHKWDWKKSIAGCIDSLPRDVLIPLLYHRPDMQENAFVNDQEKKLVQDIKNYYNSQ